jgi:phosphoribosylamine---glycine ligase
LESALKLLVVGNGAREHALSWKLAQSPRIKQIYALPGNAGTASVATNIDLPVSDVSSIAAKAAALKVDLVVIGPEGPLAAGLTDLLEKAGVPVFGPSMAASQLEASKVFARDLMQENGIPCALGNSFDRYEDARRYLGQQQAPIVVKADGLAAGKGVTVAAAMEEAVAALDSMMKARVFGAAGDRVIIEECLIGKEVSLLAFTDGNSVVPMVPACDYKRVFDADRGPNTGGMGSYSPPGFFGPEMTQKILTAIIQPVVDAMRKRGTPYKGVLYTGLILTAAGPKVLEFNARFGDPETQAILPRLKTDLVEVMLAVVNGNLNKLRIEWADDPCVGVVMASGGYPGDYRTGLPITITGKLDEGVNVFYAGANKSASGAIVTAGGRVLTVTATGKTVKLARDWAYRNIARIHFEGCHYRKDIAQREVA